MEKQTEDEFRSALSHTEARTAGILRAVRMAPELPAVMWQHQGGHGLKQPGEALRGPHMAVGLRTTYQTG